MTTITGTTTQGLHRGQLDKHINEHTNDKSVCTFYTLYVVQ